jgi:histidine phosphotransferase ChpT
MELIRDAVGDAQARVRFFRLAFGAAGPDQMTSGREAASTLGAFFRAGRVTPDWAGAQDLPRRQVKLAYLMVLCAESALPMGGQLSIAPGPAGQWQLQAEGPRLAVDDALWSVLRFGAAAAGRALRPAEAQFLALHVLAEDMGMTVNFVAEDGALRMSTT